MPPAPPSSIYILLDCPCLPILFSPSFQALATTALTALVQSNHTNQSKVAEEEMGLEALTELLEGMVLPQQQQQQQQPIPEMQQPKLPGLRIDVGEAAVDEVPASGSYLLSFPGGNNSRMSTGGGAADGAATMTRPGGTAAADGLSLTSTPYRAEV